MSEFLAMATKLEVGIEGQGPEQFIAAMSAALRKVARQSKAEGMREAGNIVTEHYQELSTEHRLLVVARQTAINAAASKLETPTE
ncbi:MAG: hypothetical protein Q8L53_16820 [Aestuariivirga sp.]|nr:hypothetical protein [Aestuariivirga sp.]